MEIQNRILKFVTVTNWVLLLSVSAAGLVFFSAGMVKGIIFGGLIVTINFHLLYRTLKKALKPPHLSPYQAVIAKYYIRFFISGLIIFFLISNHIVNPLGLFIGLSVVVASIMLATLLEIKKLFFKEAT